MNDAPETAHRAAASGDASQCPGSPRQDDHFDDVVWHVEHALRQMVTAILRRIRSPGTRQDVLGTLLDLVDALAKLQTRDGNLSKAGDAISMVLDGAVDEAIPAINKADDFEVRYAERRIIDGSLRLLAATINRSNLQAIRGKNDLHNALDHWRTAMDELRAQYRKVLR